MINGSPTSRSSKPKPSESDEHSPETWGTREVRSPGRGRTKSSGQCGPVKASSYLAQSLRAGMEMSRLRAGLIQEGFEEVLPGEFLSPQIMQRSRLASQGSTTQRRRRLISERAELLAKLAGLKKVREWMQHQKK